MTTLPILYEIFLESSSISTDTRSVKKNDLFFALKGDNFDGNKFAYQALEKGASHVVVDDASVIPAFDEHNKQKLAYKNQYLLVDNVLESLQKLANFHRKQFTIPFIGITGSNGKTTTKELLRSVLSQKFKTYSTEGNLNNHIGVPLTILRMPKNTEIAIIEMGANKVGDIAELCKIAEPNFGMITNIGNSHLEGFGSYEGVLRGKTELYQSLIKNNGTVFINSDDSVLMNMEKRFESEKVIKYGTDPMENNYYLAILSESVPVITYKDEKNNKIKTQLTGAYNFPNILSALAFGKFFGLSSSQMNKGIFDYLPKNNRSQVEERTETKNTLILDAYNANPDSMKAALLHLEELPKNGKQKIAILADMFELGKESFAKHKQVLDLALQLKIDKLIVCGTDFQKAKSTGNLISSLVLSFDDKKELTEYLQENPITESIILLKGSRGMGLETVVELL
ncbi:UDP-N-acetylmuramoyl-tripeptide--D-alanyl-D-alanine ligase [Bernardetia litoralis DSM 6794]|uniref:UDP-N-acetylmuramoyl-tripeptide--D-alanyl-D-alanine ligase n=1 Tax=Bernardetia litoralis (strain ATCC 23117 / DSM 6794 / NBRC 15988 / NCIMB 1366 / Fx l1 / Sio-4) TaxID=880071 RepID=I4AJF7_BERLS|nr:UDP-N-acetylmuramoyl-tripeptide--D-alanyl-D-alanine ligase [Bernardetia litoralis]AFM04092.1 UDP-N-acetylmuramoyl-tripeptide--D-alanyl-D-alanine ligase [Bernardetia litoralis DSM 6794]